MDSTTVPVLRNRSYASLLDDVMQSLFLETAALVPGPLHGPDSPLGQKTFALIAAFAHAVASRRPDLLTRDHLAIAVYAKPDSEVLQAPWYFLRALWGQDINMSLTLMTDGPAPVIGYDPTLFTAVIGDHHLPQWVRENRYDLVVETFAELPLAVKAEMADQQTTFITERVALSIPDHDDPNEPLPCNVTRLFRYHVELVLSHPRVTGVSKAADEVWRWDLGLRTDVRSADAIALANWMLSGNDERNVRRTIHG
jgi:hypothetical protein